MKRVEHLDSEHQFALNRRSVDSPAPEFSLGDWSIEELAGVLWLQEKRNRGASGKEIGVAYGLSTQRVYQIVNKALARQRQVALALDQSDSLVDLLIDVAGWGDGCRGPENLSLMGLLMDLAGDPQPSQSSHAKYQRMPPQ